MSTGVKWGRSLNPWDSRGHRPDAVTSTPVPTYLDFLWRTPGGETYEDMI